MRRNGILEEATSNGGGVGDAKRYAGWIGRTLVRTMMRSMMMAALILVVMIVKVMRKFLIVCRDR